MNKRVLLILAPEFEELEAIAPIDLLRRAQIEVITASLKENTHVKGRNGITILADTNLDTVINDTFDMLILPGGPGTKYLKEDPRVLDLSKKYQSDKSIAAICAAPTVLHVAGILYNKKYTAHSSTKEELQNILPDPVVIDKNIITSRGAGTAVEFALSIIEYLTNKETKEQVQQSIEYQKNN